MTLTTWARFILGVVVIASSVAVLDAGRAGSWDLVVLGSTAAACTVVLLLSSVTGRRAIPVRADLARWLERSAAEGGERAGDVADRAVAAYRAGLTDPGVERERDGARASR